jgi:hypothetical protein
VAGTICAGGGSLQTQTSTTPVAGAASQVMLVQQPLPMANNLVNLVTNIPTKLAAIAAELKVPSVLSRQVCRGTYCIACDGTATCVPRMWIGLGQGTKYTFNVSIIPTDTLVYVVRTNPLFCAPTIGLNSEYLTGNTFILTSISKITSVTFSCATNKGLTNSLSVRGTTASRRLLQAGSQLAVTNDTLDVSLIVPTEEVEATQQLVEANNLAVHGFAASLDANETHAEVAQCPENSTSPIGATRLSQCHCIPGYKGNASQGTACAPCEMGQYCSGGIMGLCPLGSTAPPLSNSSSDCACDLGFYGSPGKCLQCPANAYCMRGTLHPCTANAASAPQSASPQSCICRPGWYGSDNQPCQPCKPGFWCTGSVSNACPQNWTSNANTTRSADCFCQDGFESVSTRDSGGYAIDVCQACTGSTYCKVRPPRVRVYNARRADPIE